MGLPRSLAVAGLVLAAAGLTHSAAPLVRLVDLYGDALPPGAVARLGTVRWRPPGGLSAFRFVPGGKHIATANKADLWGKDPSHGSTLSLWDLKTGRLIRTIREQVTPLRNGFAGRLAFTPDGRRILSADALYGKEGLWLSPQARQPGLFLWDVSSGNLISRSPDVENEPHCTAISQDGKLAACGTHYGDLILWSPGTTKLRHLLRGDGRCQFEAMGFSDDRKDLVVIFRKEKYECQRISVASGKVVQRFLFGEPGRVALSPDGSTAATYDSPVGQLLLHDTATGKSRLLRFSEKVEYLELQFSDDGRTLLTADHWGNMALIWDAANARLLRVVPVPGLAQTDQGSLLISNDRKTLLTTQEGRAVRLWDAHSGETRLHYSGHVTPPTRVAFTPDGQEVVSFAYCFASPGEVYRWGAASGNPLRRHSVPPFRGSQGEWPHRLYSPNRRYLATKNKAQLGTLCDLETGDNLVLRGGEAAVTAWTFTLDSRSLIVGDTNRVLWFWDTAKGAVTRKVDLAKETKEIVWVCFSPDKSRVATGEGSGEVHLWNAATFKLLATMMRPDSRKPDQPTIDEWETLFSPNGRYLVLSSTTNLWIWDVEERREIGPFEEDNHGHRSCATRQVAVSPDSRLLAWIDSGGAFRLHEIASGRIVHRLDNVSDGFAFSPSGWRLATGCSADGSVLVWDLPTLFRLGAPSRPAPSPEALWADLADADAARAHRAAWRLAALPEADAFLARRLLPVEPVADARLGSLVADLGDASFPTREKAELALAAGRDGVRNRLAQALRGAADLEVRKRLQRLLKPLGPREPERLRECRAVLALEARATPEARQLLRRYAAGVPGARLTREAKDACRRLGERP